MTDSEKLVAVKAILGITDTSEDTLLSTYLSLAKSEIISWRFSYATDDLSTVLFPAEYDVVHVQAVIAGYTIRGAEGQKEHVENGISRTFAYDDMVAYIHKHIPAYCKVM